MNEYKNNELVYPELSYEVMGVIFKVYNQLGFGLREKYYQRGIAIGFDEKGIKHEMEREIKLTYNGKLIGKYFLDFIIENKIILEFKVSPIIKKTHLRQALEYLRATNLKLAILVCFTHDKVIYKRIINPDYKEN